MAVRWSAVIDADNGFVGWADEELFRAWASRAVALAGRQSGLDGARSAERFAVQRDAVRELVEAVCNAYRALDVPGPADPECTAAVLGAFNNADTPTVGDPPIGGAWLRSVSPYLFNGELGSRVELARCWIDWRGEPHTDPLTRDPGAYIAQGGRAEWFATAGARPFRDWSYLGAGRECITRPGIECLEWLNRIVPPALWEYWLWGALAARLADRSAWEVIRDARDFTIIRNLNVMRAFNVFGAGQDLTNLIGAAELQAQATRDGAPINKLGRAMGALAGPLLAFPPAGTAIGLVLGGIATAIEAFGPAVMVNVDGWGRRQPAFSPWRISGGPGMDEKPTHVVAEPPGFSRRPRGTLRVLLPRELPSARARVDGAELRASMWEGEVVAGPHLVEVSADGRTPQARTINVRVGERADWTVAFVRPEERRSTVEDFTGGGAPTGGGRTVAQELGKLLNKGDDRREAIGLARRTAVRREELLKQADGSADALVALMAADDQNDLGGSNATTGGTGTTGGASTGGASTGGASTGGQPGRDTDSGRPVVGVLVIEAAEGRTLPAGTLVGAWRVESRGPTLGVEVETAREFGAAPVTLAVRPGSYLVRWRFPGVADGERTVDVIEGATTTVALKPPRAGLRAVASVVVASAISVAVWKAAEWGLARARSAPAPRALPPAPPEPR